MDKKAMVTIETVITLAIALLGAGAVAWGIYQFVVASPKAEAELICKGSVEARIATATEAHIKGVKIATLRPVPFLCKTIDEQRVSGDEDNMKKFIADKMARCYWMFGEGTQDDLFDTIDVGDVHAQNDCFVCYQFVAGTGFDTISKIDFGNYLGQTIYPVFNDTYLNYFQFSGSKNGVFSVSADIEPKHSYAIAFQGRASKPQYLRAIIGSLGALVAGGAAGGAAGVKIGIISGALGGPAAEFTVPAGVIIGAVVGGGIGGYYLAGDEFSKLLKERDVNKVYFDRLDELTKKCRIIAGVGGS